MYRLFLVHSKVNQKNEWVKGKTEMITGEEADKAIKLRKKKYGMFARLTGIFYISKRKSCRLFH